MPDPRPAFDKIVLAQLEELKQIDPMASAIARQILDYTKIRNKDLGKETFVCGLLTGLLIGSFLSWLWL
jgi:hypothetical protein